MLLQSAVTEALFCRSNVNHLFNCLPQQLMSVLPPDLAVGVAGMGVDAILQFSTQLLCAERLRVLCARYETTGLLSKVLDENPRLSDG